MFMAVITNYDGQEEFTNVALSMKLVDEKKFRVAIATKGGNLIFMNFVKKKKTNNKQRISIYFTILIFWDS